LQQIFGPLYELEFANLTNQTPSDTLNHVPNASATSGGRKFDELGVRQYSYIERPKICEHSKKILFLGDSFMEGYDDAHTIPSLLAKLLAKENICIEPFNAGQSSYSPAIFVPQIRILYSIIKPDYIIIDVDETDFYDDNVRYKEFITRDVLGRNIAVKSGSNYRDVISEVNDVRAQNSYIMRLIKIQFTKYLKIINSSASQQTREYDAIFELSKLDADSARAKFKDELSFFESNIQEIISALKEYNFDMDHLMFIRHPHLEHLSGGAGRPAFNSLIFEAVKEVAVANSVKIYDSMPDLQAAFNGRPETYYFKNDMHFNFRGMEAYSEAVSAKLAPLLAK
jgi:lysophospholipase L1-like esterase